MQIVIDIDEEMYANVRTEIERVRPSRDARWTRLLIAICRGIHLPKGHGALKDADEVMKVMERNLDMQDLYLPIHFKQFALDEAQTIVPADKEVEE